MDSVDHESVNDHHIGGKSQTRGVDAVIAALAERQHGVVARRQLVALGLSRREIERRIEQGRLHLLHAGVYAVGHRVLSPHGRWMAAVLAAGPDAVLSHRSAAALWGLRATSRTRIEVTAPRDLRPRKGLHPHCAVLPDDERTIHQGIPVTTPARTLLDLAGVLERQALDRALDEAEALRLPGPAALLERYPRKRATATLTSSPRAAQPRPAASSRTASSPSSRTRAFHVPRRTPSSRDTRSTRYGARRD